MALDRWKLLRGIDDPDVQFELITRCTQHPEYPEANAVPCAHDSGVLVVGAPVFCQRPSGHEERHLSVNGGHACWSQTEDGHPIDATFRDFHIKQ